MFMHMLVVNLIAIPLGFALNLVTGGGLEWMLDNPSGALLSIALAEVILWLVLLMEEAVQADGEEWFR